MAARGLNLRAEIPMSGRTGTVPAGVRTPGRIAAEREGSGAGPAVRPDEAGRGVPLPPGWSLRSCLELGELPSAVPCARLHTRQVLWEWSKQRVLHWVAIRVMLRGDRSRVPGWGRELGRYGGRGDAGVTCAGAADMAAWAGLALLTCVPDRGRAGCDDFASDAISGG